MSTQNIPLYVPMDTGPSFWGPGDRYIFLVTGQQSSGAYFIMEAVVPPAGGPPPHLHRREQESLYLLDGTLDIQIEDKVIQASAGSFVHIPCGTVHCFRNTTSTTVRMLRIFAPGGIEDFLQSTLEPVLDRHAAQPETLEAVLDRYRKHASQYGLEFV